MSQLHRQLLGQIMAAIDPIVETALTIANPAVGAGSRVLLTDLETFVNADGTTSATATVTHPGDAPIAAAGTTVNSPLPDDPVQQHHTAAENDKAAAAPAPDAAAPAPSSAPAPVPAAPSSPAPIAPALTRRSPAPAPRDMSPPAAAPSSPDPAPSSPPVVAVVAAPASSPPLSAKDVIEALMATLMSLESRT